MEIFHITKRALRVDDEALLSAIMAAQPPQSGGTLSVIGVRNEAGCLYRIVTTEGPEEFNAVAGQLESLGFIDSLKGQRVRLHGCDAIFLKR